MHLPFAAKAAEHVSQRACRWRGARNLLSVTSRPGFGRTGVRTFVRQLEFPRTKNQLWSAAWSGRPGGYPPGLPRIRTCRFPASGSSVVGFATCRVSRDIDWFTSKPFEAKGVAEALNRLSEKPTEVSVQGPHTLRAYYGSLETRFIRYTQVTARPEVVTAGMLKIPVADLETLALMKALRSTTAAPNATSSTFTPFARLLGGQ
jgi:hypothetical protein